MKHIKALQKLNQRLFSRLIHHNQIVKALASSSPVLALSAFIWFAGASLTWHDYAPLASDGKRLYAILVLFLLWLLKFLLLRQDKPDPAQYGNASLQKKLQDLQNHFAGAIAFLKKSAITKQGAREKLEKLPWFLLIGPQQAGKSTLLANAQVHYILQKQYHGQDTNQLAASENCNWWVTRDLTIIDIPGKYLHYHQQVGAVMWDFFLRMVKGHCGKRRINGALIALPLPEIMQQDDPQKYHNTLHHLFARLAELEQQFPQATTCHLIITKCDLLPGFAEFFSEFSDEEINQAWGIQLGSKQQTNLHEAVSEQLNQLIKKLNQQLLWRLHQERNPALRPAIKDFPLQVERLKEFIIDFTKRLASSKLTIHLQSIHLTSATQVAPKKKNTTYQQAHAATQELQLLKAPAISARAYFIRQFIGQLRTPSTVVTLIKAPTSWKRRLAYVISVAAIAGATFFLGKDFQLGVQHTYAMQKKLNDYQYVVQQPQDLDGHLLKTLQLLNTLHQAADNGFKFDWEHITAFYSNKSKQRDAMLYQHTLTTVLVPEIANYLADYLSNPINKNTENLYAALKSYLMLGHLDNLQIDYVAETVDSIVSKTITLDEKKQLAMHLKTALRINDKTLSLNQTLIQETRQYFLAMQSLRLSYIILKNKGDNNASSGISLENNHAFDETSLNKPIAAMFTAQAFSDVYTNDIPLAATETVKGNHVLGETQTAIDPNLIANLTQQLRMAYLSYYVSTWEGLINNIQLSKMNSLAETDKLILNLISNNSPLLQLLQLTRANTYFEPVTSTSVNLKNLGALLGDKNTANEQLYQVFTGLQGLHQYLQPVLTADNPKHAAFTLMSNRMAHLDNADAITQLRIIADKSPAPLQAWLLSIADNAWHYLMEEAGHYLDVSWQTQVIQPYQAAIANRYPFGAHHESEVDIQQFVAFFGNPGVVFNFYDNYLRQFVDASKSDWEWKKLNGKKLPFSDETLRQIQHAMRIHHVFFPNGDNKLFVQFALQPYEFDDDIESVKLNINDKQFVDANNAEKNSHVFSWPNHHELKLTQVQLNLANNQVINRHFSGAWGWFKLVSQSFESAVNKNEIVINLSQNEHAVKYRVFTEKALNPFLALNMQHFNLPTHVINNA